MAANLLTRHPAASAVTLYATCLAAAWLTELLSAVPGAGVSIWLPTGFLMAAAIATPVAKWPIWALAAIAAEFTGNYLWYQHDIGPAALLVAGNSLAALIGAWCTRKLIADRFIFTTLRSGMIFLIIAAILVPSISSTICSVALGWSYGNPPLAAWQRLILGDASGAIVAAPLGLLVFGAAAPLRQFATPKLIEAGALILIFGALGGLSLGGVVPLAFLMITPMLWAALRFGAAGAILSASALTVLAAFFTVTELSQLTDGSIYGIYGPRGLQAFLLVAGTTALLVGAIAEENRQAIGQLHQSNRTLEDRVAERSATLAASEGQARETANLLAAIGEACPDLIYAKNLQHEIIYANSAARAVLALQPQDRPNAASADEQDQVRRNDEQVIASGETIIVEEALTLESGERRIFRSTKAPLYDGDGAVSGLAGVSVDITENKRSEARERMLVREVEHRARNLLAVVQGVVQLTHASSVPEFKTAIGKRIRALAKTNSAIAASAWQGASLLDILREELLPYDDVATNRIRLVGEDVALDPATAQSLTLVIHELTTNAAKYGALSSANGTLEIIWTSDQPDEGNSVLTLDWRERGGPPVAAPDRKGFGTTVITAFGEERPGSSVDFAWDREGLRVKIVVPLTRSRSSTPIAADIMTA